MLEAYDLRLKKTAKIENATNISLHEEINKPTNYKLTFDLPYNDPKTEHCKIRHFIKVETSKGVFEFYRILFIDEAHSTEGMNRYTCEHGSSTLLDDILEGYHQRGNLGVFTNQVLQYVLNKQDTVYWQLGTCDFVRQFEYSWEHDTLLSALFSVANPIVDDYIWTYNFQTTPWTINLKANNKAQSPKSYFRYKKNIKSMKRTIDTSELCTRLFVYGYGEGINQLNIARVNGGRKYLDASPANVAKYGRITKTLVDRRFQYEDTLLAYGQKNINAIQEPRYEYSLEIINLRPVSGDVLDEPRIGDITRVIDREVDIDIKRPITSRTINNLGSESETVVINVENSPKDIVGSLADLENRQNVERLYAQGQGSIYSQTFNANAEPTFPAVIKFWIPPDTVRVNSVMMLCEFTRFRANSKGALAGGGETISSSTWPTQTSSSQPAQAYSSSTSNAFTATSGSSSINTTASAPQTGSAIYESSIEISQGNGHHIHQGANITGGILYDHVYTHRHNMDHYHHSVIPGHGHTTTIPGHSHTVASHHHVVQSQAHSHATIFGIYEGPRATAGTVRVDGKVVPVSFIPGQEIDLAPYLSVNTSGMVATGTHHTIEVYPNTLTGVMATVTTELFTQSHGRVA